MIHAKFSFLLLPILLVSCNKNKWVEVNPLPYVRELIAEYRLPLDAGNDASFRYLAAIQQISRGEFVAIRIHGPQSAMQKIEASCDKEGARRQESEEIDPNTRVKVAESIHWWPSRPIVGRRYSMVPTGLTTSLLEVYFPDNYSDGNGDAYFILTPKHLYLK